MKGFKSKKEQSKCINSLKDRGITLRGWARTRGFSEFTVNNLLLRDDMIGRELGPVAEKIMAQLKEEGLA